MIIRTLAHGPICIGIHTFIPGLDNSPLVQTQKSGHLSTKDNIRRLFIVPFVLQTIGVCTFNHGTHLIRKFKHGSKVSRLDRFHCINVITPITRSSTHEHNVFPLYVSSSRVQRQVQHALTYECKIQSKPNAYRTTGVACTHIFEVY